MAGDSTPEAFVRCLRPAMLQAASIASALEGRVPNVPKTEEATPVKAALTIADTASQEALLVPLSEGFRTARLEAEEDTPSVAHFDGSAVDRRIVVDPIDGTLRFFLEGQGPYAIMAGLAVHDRYVAALVALPRERRLFQAVQGGGAEGGESGHPAEAVGVTRSGRRLLLSDGTPPPVREALEARGYEIGLGCGGAIAVAPLLPGVRGGVRVAKSDSVSTRGRIGLLISREAGAIVRTGDGEDFPARIDEPATALVVASDEEVARDLLEALSVSPP